MADYYASPTGLNTNPGTIGQPFDLQTALNSGSPITAGDTLWLRGGTYNHLSNPKVGTETPAFRWLNTKGAAGNVITVRPVTGEVAIIEGGVQAQGPNVLWDCDYRIIMHNAAAHVTDQPRADGIRLLAANHKFRNPVVRNCGNAVSSWSSAPESDVYGGILFNNGWQGNSDVTDGYRNGGNGHGIYIQNGATTRKFFKDTVTCYNAASGAKLYAQSGPAENVLFEGIIAYCNGKTGAHGTIIVNDGDATIGEPQLLGGSSNSPLTNFDVESCYTWQQPNINGLAFWIGQGLQNQQNNSVRNSVFFGGAGVTLQQQDLGNYQFSNNKVFGRGQNLLSISTYGSNTVATAGLNLQNNQYWSYNSWPNPFTNNDTFTNLTWAQWQAQGIDSTSIYSQPTGKLVYVRPNQYKAKFGFVVIYNFTGDSSAAVDLSSILAVGDTYTIDYPERFLDDVPTLVGTYTGGTVNIPLKATHNNYEFTVVYVKGEPGSGSAAQPVITALLPDAADTGASQFNMIVTGAYFQNGATVRWNGADLFTTYLNETQLQARVTAGLLLTAGPVPVTVRNPDGQVSTAAVFSVNGASIPNPPIIATATLPSGTQGVAYNQTLAATSGTTPYGWTVTSGSLPAGLTLSTGGVISGTPTTVGSQTVTIRCTGANGQWAQATYTISINTGAAPSLSSISPTTANAGGAQFTLTVNGSGFVSGGTVKWNGNNLTTTFVSSSQVTAVVPAPNIASAGSAVVTFANPTGQVSNSLTFTINAVIVPAPSLTSLSPVSTLEGVSSFVLTVNGANFVSGAEIRWNGSALTTTFGSATQLTATIDAALVSNSGVGLVTVRNPDTQVSNTLSFTVIETDNPVPTISTLSPSTVTPGGSTFTLTVTGANFVNGAVIRVNGATRTTTLVSSTQLTTTIQASEIASATTLAISVSNPAPGGGLSNNLNLSVSSSSITYPTPTPGMRPIKTTLRPRQGNTFRLAVDFDNGLLPINFANCTARLQARQGIADENATVLVDLTTANGGIVIDSQTIGRIWIVIEEEITAGFSWQAAFFELTVATPTDDTITILEGDMRVKNRVTVL